MAKTQKQEVTIDISALAGIAKEIETLDTQISAASGNDASVRKSIAEKLATDNASTVDGIVSQIVGAVEGLDLAVVIGLRSKLDDVLAEKFDVEIKTFLDAEVEKATSGSKEDVTALRASRKEKVDNFRALETILTTFGIDTSSVPEPKRATRGSGGGGGSSVKTAQNKEGYRFQMDGEDRPDSQNTLSSLAFYATKGCAGENERWSTADLKKFITEKLEEQGLKYGEADTWALDLPNGKNISVRRFTDEEIAGFEAAKAEAKAKADETKSDDKPAETPEA